MKNISKILAIVLSAIISISIVPISSNAETYSGKCGDNLTWTYDDTTNKLMISGTGEMYNFYSYDFYPWKDYRDSIVSVTISSGVTSIGDNAFMYCNAVEEVKIGDSVTTIGDNAFRGCYNLKNMTIPASVTSIGHKAFAQCGLAEILVDEENLYYSNDEYGVLFDKDKSTLIQYPFNNDRTIYNIPDSVNVIEDNAFSDCEYIVNVTIPDSVTSIGCDVFRHCGQLEELVVDCNNQYYSSDGCGVLFNKDKTILLQYPAGNPRTGYEIPDSVKIIGDAAFYSCYKLTSVTIPDGVVKIGKSSFQACTGLLSIIIPGSVVSIDELAFQYCINLAGVKFNYGLTTIGKTAFHNCKKLAGVIFPDSLISIGEQAFAFCDSLTTITIPESVCEMGDNTFDRCYGLISILVDSDNQFFSNDKNGVLFNKDKTILIQYPIGNTRKIYTIPNSVNTIADRAFLWCENIISVIIGDSVTKIDELSFSSCIKLVNVTMSNSVTFIGDAAFSNCHSLTDVFYGGTEEEWNDILIDGFNDPLLNANIHFNHYKHFDEDNDGVCEDCGMELCDHDCHKTGFEGFLWKIINFFNILLGRNKECACGVSHY